MPVTTGEISFGGKKYRSRHHLAHAYGFHHSSLNWQINKFKSVDDAMNYLLRRERRKLAWRLQNEGLMSADEPV